ncbi:MAG TPA: DHHA1 domain-containing protein, partial [Thermoplasmata archaeon]|nr:DHHA1 domain-containing protein [Thermoplasmata archaeon]
GNARLWQAVVNPGTAEELKRLAATIIREPGSVVALAARNGSASVLVARSPDVDLDCLLIAKSAAMLLGGGGGGASDFAQGGGPNLDMAEKALEAAVSAIRERLGQTFK